MLNHRNWISSKTILGSTFMAELLKNRRRVVWWLIIISTFAKLLKFNSFSASFSFSFLFFPLCHPFADSLQPVRTCPCSEEEQEAIRMQSSLCLPQVREQCEKELLVSYTSAHWNVHKPAILSSKVEILKVRQVIGRSLWEQKEDKWWRFLHFLASQQLTKAALGLFRGIAPNLTSIQWLNVPVKLLVFQQFPLVIPYYWWNLAVTNGKACLSLKPFSFVFFPAPYLSHWNKKLKLKDNISENNI